MKLINQTTIKSYRANPKWLFLFLTGVALGMLLVLFNREVFLQDTFFFGEEVLKRFTYSSIYKEPFFYYVFKNRMSAILLLIFTSVTILGIFFLYIFWLWFGISAGAILTTLIWKYHLKGGLLFCGMFLPHAMIYVPCFIALSNCLYKICKRTNGTNHMQDLGRDLYEDKNTFYLKRIIVILCVFIALFLGIILESYVNPILLKKLLNLF